MNVYCSVTTYPNLVWSGYFGTPGYKSRIRYITVHKTLYCRPLHHQVELPVTRTKNFFDLNTIQSYTLAPGNIIYKIHYKIYLHYFLFRSIYQNTTWIFLFIKYTYCYPIHHKQLFNNLGKQYPWKISWKWRYTK